MSGRRTIPLVLMLLLLCVLSAQARDVATHSSVETCPGVRGERGMAYAVVIKQSTYDDAQWAGVADSLLARYSGQLFIWTSSLYDVQVDLSTFRPTHVGLVCELGTASASFVQSMVWPFMRSLDGDNYCDAIWGIVTGYDSDDALRLVTGPTGFDVKTVLGGTSSCDLAYYTQGIATNEATYGLYYVKYPDSLATTTHTDGPTDRTEWLVTMINQGIRIFNDDPVDIMYTSGHGDHNMWQMHYPSSGLEGFFRSSSGQVYGDPYSGANFNINSDHPRIYFGLGNCYIGKILSGSSMVPSWIHTGGAYQYTGYVMYEGGTSHQHGGTKAYFYKAARQYTWAEAYYLANQALRFDMLNGTPGASPPDLNGSALYGDPGMRVRMSHEGVYREPLFDTELTTSEGATQDTVTFRMTMNREGSPGYTSKWGERHPATILPFRAENVSIVSTDAISAVVEDDFVLLYAWYQGQPSLPEGATREVVFTCDHVETGIDEGTTPESELVRVTLRQNCPNPFNPVTNISYTLSQQDQVLLQIYSVDGRLVETLVDGVRQAGDHSARWDAGDVTSGLYFYRITVGGASAARKCLVLK